ncbi:MAG: cupin domain-containing protein [Xanthobacteraceae bacterium]|nr:cupin domain-containing protein [Xanthobacteraceae bacterium]
MIAAIGTHSIPRFRLRFDPWRAFLFLGVLSLPSLFLPLRMTYSTLSDIGLADICYASAANTDGRPSTIITNASTQILANGKRITTLFVRFPPRAFTPKHIHGGEVNAYIVKGTVRSQLAGQPVHDFKPGEVLFEPIGAVHLFAENPSADEWAELVAVIVHDEGAALTTFINKPQA